MKKTFREILDQAKREMAAADKQPGRPWQDRVLDVSNWRTFSDSILRQLYELGPDAPFPARQCSKRSCATPRRRRPKR